MNPQLPAITGKELVHALQKVGWILTHTRGSHHQLENVHTKERISVAVHAGKEIRPWLLKKILKQIQLDEEEFRKLL
jgi:predicted RNA binding protein YcfA (HicA-like mRNA interferase family)